MVNQYLSHDQHINNLKFKKSKIKDTNQSFISNIHVNYFKEDFFQIFISTKIQLFKLQNPTHCAFLKIYTKGHIINESII